MKTKVYETGSELRIRIDQVGSDQAAALAALQECSEGRCTCPTSQYEKLKSVDIASGPDGISIALKPKPGETLDRSAIERCLEYTARQLAQRK